MPLPRRLPPLARVVALAACLATTAACGPEAQDSVPASLPPLDTAPDSGPRDTATTWTFIDTASPDLDETPAHALHVYQDGDWTLSPEGGGPYATLVGTLLVLELLDVERPADSADSPYQQDTGLAEARLCSLSWMLTGEPADPPCEACEFSFAVTHALLEGDPSTCHDPDLPADGEVRRLGYRSDGWIVYDYGGSGAWLPWYRAEQEGDVLAWSWATVLGIAVEEEDSG